MNVKDAIKARLEYVMNYHLSTEEKYPMIPWVPTIDPRIYVGKKDADGWIGWKPIEKNIFHDMIDIEQELGTQIHNSIKEYFNSYWFLQLYIPFSKMKFLLTSVPPNEEFKHVLEPWKVCKENFGENLYLSLGVEQNGKYSLMVNNKTGEVATFDHDTKKITKIFDNLADFIYSPLKNLKKS